MSQPQQYTIVQWVDDSGDPQTDLDYTDTTEYFSTGIHVPRWCSHVSFNITATHAGTYDIQLFNYATETWQTFHEGEATVAVSSAPEVASLAKLDLVVPMMRVAWTSGTSASGTLNGTVFFGGGGLR